jgi:hypothetical protein
MFNEEHAVSLIFAHNRLGIFSDLLHHKSSYILSEIVPLTTLLVSLSFPPYLPTRRAIPPLPVVSCQRLAIPTYAVSADIPHTLALIFLDLFFIDFVKQITKLLKNSPLLL